MATTPRERQAVSPLNKLTTGLLAAGLGLTHVANIARAETIDIHPTLSITSSAVKQVNIQGTPSDRTVNASGVSHELVTVVSPGLQVAAHGAHTLIDGLIHLDAFHYARGTQSNQVVPNGHLVGQLLSRDTGTGIEAAWEARQVPKQFVGNTSGSTDPNNDYTQTEWRIAPYLNRQIGSDTQVKAKLERRLFSSDQKDTAPAPLPKSNTTTATASIQQRPVPFGYELSFRRQGTNTSQKILSEGDELSQRYIETTRMAKALYALLPELEVGLLIGQEQFDLQNDRISTPPYSGQVRGWSFDWRPQERTSLAVQVEHHSSGKDGKFLPKTWQIDASHRMTWLAFGATFSRQATPPIPPDPSKVINDIGSIAGVPPASVIGPVAYSLAAQLRQESSGRMAFIGRRDTITLSGGRVDSSPLTPNQGLLPTASITRDYFFSTDWVHRLSPQWQLSNGVRWTRSNLTLLTTTGPLATLGSSHIFTRDFSWRSALTTDLSPSAKATLGVRRKIGHTDTVYGDGSETAAFAGLDYKF